MSTAAELQLICDALRPELERMRQRVEATVVQPLVSNCMHQFFGREVCARRARRLRKRGEDVRFWRLTPTGKARYSWLPPPLQSQYTFIIE